MTVTWRIRRRCPTVNDWHGPKPWKYAALAREWLREFPPASTQKAKARRRVEIVRIFPTARGQRRYDADNLRGGVKPILDALVKLGWLVNDSDDWLQLVVDQRHPQNGEWAPSTLVLIKDLA